MSTDAAPRDGWPTEDRSITLYTDHHGTPIPADRVDSSSEWSARELLICRGIVAECSPTVLADLDLYHSCQRGERRIDSRVLDLAAALTAVHDAARMSFADRCRVLSMHDAEWSGSDQFPMAYDPAVMFSALTRARDAFDTAASILLATLADGLGDMSETEMTERADRVRRVAAVYGWESLMTDRAYLLAVTFADYLDTETLDHMCDAATMEADEWAGDSDLGEWVARSGRIVTVSDSSGYRDHTVHADDVAAEADYREHAARIDAFSEGEDR